MSWQNLKSLVLAGHSLGNISSSSGINEKKNGKEARRTRSSWLGIEYRGNTRSNSGTVPVRNDRLPLFNLQCEKKKSELDRQGTRVSARLFPQVRHFLCSIEGTCEGM